MANSYIDHMKQSNDDPQKISFLIQRHVSDERFKIEQRKKISILSTTLTIPVPLSQTRGWMSSPSAIF